MKMWNVLAILALLAVMVGFAMLTSRNACARGACVPTFCAVTGPSCPGNCSCQWGSDNITGFCG